MRPDTLKYVRIAKDIVDNPAAWDKVGTRFANGLCDAFERRQARENDPPLVVLGQGDFTQEIHGKDVTGFFPLARAVRGFGRALLRFLRVRR